MLQGAVAVLDRFDEEDVLPRNRQRTAALSAALAPMEVDTWIEKFRRAG
ncbi:hypothetical protein [Variovorax soli]|uniref:Uncharacterized protein n=1 Tax=Variovorax soli TaxID=376815 RepID=A0ABU1NMN3_9BURK|nr:hypothetical protein [Variovorax soli]MDR6539712.1 hypothetical protein [Variovorax soli]